MNIIIRVNSSWRLRVSDTTKITNPLSHCDTHFIYASFFSLSTITTSAHDFCVRIINRYVHISAWFFFFTICSRAASYTVALSLRLSRTRFWIAVCPATSAVDAFYRRVVCFPRKYNRSSPSSVRIHGTPSAMSRSRRVCSRQTSSWPPRRLPHGFYRTSPPRRRTNSQGQYLQIRTVCEQFPYGKTAFSYIYERYRCARTVGSNAYGNRSYAVRNTAAPELSGGREGGTSPARHAFRS